MTNLINFALLVDCTGAILVCRCLFKVKDDFSNLKFESLFTDKTVPLIIYLLSTQFFTNLFKVLKEVL